ncbi:hypothetical protein GCM10011331_26640 [Flavimobilis marinus]|nr:hypothetical protein GCM10011331_26640 [Flavimobilis marinus]
MTLVGHHLAREPPADVDRTAGASYGEWGEVVGVGLVGVVCNIWWWDRS